MPSYCQKLLKQTFAFLGLFTQTLETILQQVGGDDLTPPNRNPDFNLKRNTEYLPKEITTQPKTKEWGQGIFSDVPQSSLNKRSGIEWK